MAKRAGKIPALPVEEWVAIPGRKFRFDFGWPDYNLAIEVQGGIWGLGAHSGGTGALRDFEKQSLAAIHGIYLITCGPSQIREGKALSWVIQFFEISHAAHLA
jgi:hypothetical protein